MHRKISHFLTCRARISRHDCIIKTIPANTISIVKRPTSNKVHWYTSKCMPTDLPQTNNLRFKAPLSNQSQHYKNKVVRGISDEVVNITDITDSNSFLQWMVCLLFAWAKYGTEHGVTSVPDWTFFPEVCDRPQKKSPVLLICSTWLYIGVIPKFSHCTCIMFTIAAVSVIVTPTFIFKLRWGQHVYSCYS